MRLWWATRPVWVSVLMLSLIHGLALGAPTMVDSHSWPAGVIVGLVDAVLIGAVSYPRTARRRRRLLEAADPIAPERLTDSLRVAFSGPERTDYPDVLGAGRRIVELRVFDAEERQMFDIVVTAIAALVLTGLSVWMSAWWWLALLGLAVATAASIRENRRLRQRLHVLQQLTAASTNTRWTSIYR